MKKRFVIVGSAIGVFILIGCGLWFLWLMNQPFYKPGNVRAGKNLRAPLTPLPQPGNTDFWQVEPDIRLRHFAIGHGRPVLIIHGGPGYPMRPPVPGFDALTNRFAFHIYDQRGAGESTRPFDRFTSRNYYANMKELERTLGLGAQIADIERIRQILGQEKLILLGHSFGGFIASLYAAEFPERIESLVLVAPADVLIMPGKNPDFLHLLRELIPQSQRGEYDQFLKGYLDFRHLFEHNESEWAAMNLKFGAYYLSAAGPTTMTNSAGHVANGGWMVQAVYTSMGRRHDYADALRRVTAPALVLHGEADIAPAEASKHYVELLPNAQFKLITSQEVASSGRAGHFLMYDAPEAFAKAVGEFLK